MWEVCQRHVCRDSNCLSCKSYGPIILLQSFLSLWKLVIRGLVWLVLLCCLAHSCTYRTPQFEFFFVSWHVRHLKGHPGWGPSQLLSASGTFRAILARVFSLSSANVCGERGCKDVSTPCVTQQYHPASMFAWLSFTSISHYNRSSLSGPLGLSPAIADLALELLSNLYAPVPSCCTF